MLLRFILSVGVTVFLQMLVIWQIRLAQPHGFLTVEDLVTTRNEKALSFDRHYAMPLDFCIIAPVVGLIVFLCLSQWDLLGSMKQLLVSIVIIAACLWLWKGGHEAHATGGHITEAGWVHALFALIVVWAILMVLVGTPKPEPVLLLVMCVVVPAFLFVGQHMFLGLINYAGNATSFPDNPLQNPVGWAMLVGVTAIVWWRSYALIPSSFWSSLQ